jgi:hypothetical protein
MEHLLVIKSEGKAIPFEKEIIFLRTLDKLYFVKERSFLKSALKSSLKLWITDL